MRMADLIGRIGEYEQGKEEWIQCCERLESYFAANEALEEAKKKTIFLADIDRFIFLQATKVFDITTKTKTHAKPKLHHHHSPTPSEIAQ